MLKRVISSAIALMVLLTFVACSSNHPAKDVKQKRTIEEANLIDCSTDENKGKSGCNL